MSNEPTPQQILALPMQQPNDARAATVRDYLVALLARLWDEGETFSGKRPLGNSCWEYDLYAPLVRAGYITGAFEIYDGREGGLDECDHVAGDSLIEAAIKALGLPDEQPQDAQPERDNLATDLWWSFGGGADTCYLEHDDNGGWRECCMRAGLAYALEVRDQQVRTETQPERDADTRAIDAMIMASVRGDSGAMALAFDNVRKRWIGRIAKLDAREAKAGEQR